MHKIENSYARTRCTSLNSGGRKYLQNHINPKTDIWYANQSQHFWSRQLLWLFARKCQRPTSIFARHRKHRQFGLEFFVTELQKNLAPANLVRILSRYCATFLEFRMLGSMIFWNFGEISFRILWKVLPRNIQNMFQPMVLGFTYSPHPWNINGADWAPCIFHRGKSLKKSRKRRENTSPTFPKPQHKSKKRENQKAGGNLCHVWGYLLIVIDKFLQPNRNNPLRWPGFYPVAGSIS